ncbi:hypothetical protein U9M48_040235 [Paspalum notatum var. saurae]|uniref:glycerol-1-phosphatase n=1 Tax=Paspalum notatum var. saurae TaxID=547442 RepID=A0AAQ3XDY0_PASNO
MPSAGADDAKPAAAAQPRAAISHVIFDMDGLLIGIFVAASEHNRVSFLHDVHHLTEVTPMGVGADTEGFYTVVQEKILSRYGKVFDWSLKAKMMGKTTAESMRILFEECGLTGLLTPEEFLHEHEIMLKELLPSCVAMPGVLRLIQHLHTNGIPIAVATRTHKHHFALKTQNHQEVFSLMHHIVTGDDPEVKAGKPSPDIFLAAMRRFDYSNDAVCFGSVSEHVEPGNCLVFEDAPLGVEAAKTAGMHVVMVPVARLDVAHHKGADQVLRSLLDFNPCEWGLLPFKD